jgi:hypothetical protein
MLKVVVLLSIFFNFVFAHGMSGEHIHIFDSIHLSDYILGSLAVILVIAIFKLRGKNV